MIYIRKQQMLEENCYTENFSCTVSYCLSQVEHILIKQANFWCIKGATMISHYTHTKNENNTHYLDLSLLSNNEASAF